MEASFSHLHRARYPPPQKPSCTSSPSSNHRRFPHLRRHGGSGSRPAMRFPNLQRITTSLNRSNRNRIQFSLKSTNHLDLGFDFNLYRTMADSDSKKEAQSGHGSNVVKDTKETEKSPEEIPPPPEKPLPGDCCGSGCVRCVWDVYYEELEEYNKLYKDGSDSTIGSKVS